MDHMHREISMALPDHTIIHIDVCQGTGTYRVLKIGLRGRRSPMLLKSFLHKRHSVAALVETSLHDAEDLGLALPYEQITDVLLAACKNIAIRTTDPVLVLRVAGAGSGANGAGTRPPRPEIEGCLLRGNETFAGIISRSREYRPSSAPNVPMSSIDREKTV
jgi:hypothetical protein